MSYAGGGQTLRTPGSGRYDPAKSSLSGLDWGHHLIRNRANVIAKFSVAKAPALAMPVVALSAAALLSPLYMRGGITGYFSTNPFNIPLAIFAVLGALSLIYAVGSIINTFIANGRVAIYVDDESICYVGIGIVKTKISEIVAVSCRVEGRFPQRKIISMALRSGGATEVVVSMMEDMPQQIVDRIRVFLSPS